MALSCAENFEALVVRSSTSGLSPCKAKLSFGGISDVEDLVLISYTGPYKGSAK